MHKALHGKKDCALTSLGVIGDGSSNSLSMKAGSSDFGSVEGGCCCWLLIDANCFFGLINCIIIRTLFVLCLWFNEIFQKEKKKFHCFLV